MSTQETKKGGDFGPQERERAIVLGAGVIGLTTAITLQEAGFNVTIWAKDFPPNTTSNKAGAFFYPNIDSNPEDVGDWMNTTAKRLKNDARHPKSGVRTAKTWSVSKLDLVMPGFAKALGKARILTDDELPEGYKTGFEYNGIIIEAPSYMDYVLAKFESLGGKKVDKEVKNLHEATAEADVVINCTGLGARELVKDSELYPIRGQVLRIQPLLRGDDRVIFEYRQPTMVMGRSDGAIAGTTFQANNWDEEPNEKDTEEILRRTSSLLALFANPDVIEEIIVGLRPGRLEIRVEEEDIDGKTVIHNYGHGGAGFSLSWGCAREVLELVEKRFPRKLQRFSAAL